MTKGIDEGQCEIKREGNKIMISQEWIEIPQDTYVYRVIHRIMEGDCQMEHGPVKVSVGPFYAAKYAVTNHMYLEFLQESGYKPASSLNYLKHWENGNFRQGDADLPVVNISQEDAGAYAAFYGFRLPSEGEWQYLAAGPEHLRWPWGNEKDYSKCNVYKKSLVPVNAHPEGVSPFGLYNMCGNVWEYTAETLTDGAGDHYFLVLRGGSYFSGSHYWHTEGGAVRNDAHLKVHLLGDAMNRFETVGFRCVRDKV